MEIFQSENKRYKFKVDNKSYQMSMINKNQTPYQKECISPPKPEEPVKTTPCIPSAKTEEPVITPPCTPYPKSEEPVKISPCTSYPKPEEPPKIPPCIPSPIPEEQVKTPICIPTPKPEEPVKTPICIPTPKPEEPVKTPICIPTPKPEEPYSFPPSSSPVPGKPHIKFDCVIKSSTDQEKVNEVPSQIPPQKNVTECIQTPTKEDTISKILYALSPPKIIDCDDWFPNNYNWWGLELLPKSFWITEELQEGKDFITIGYKNYYLSADYEGNLSVKQTVTKTELWRVIKVGKRIINLLSYYGGYLHIKENGTVDAKSRVPCNDASIHILHSFNQCELDDVNYVAFRAINGLYLSLADGKVKAVNNIPHQTEIFKGYLFNENSSKCLQPQSSSEIPSQVQPQYCIPETPKEIPTKVQPQYCIPETPKEIPSQVIPTTEACFIPSSNQNTTAIPMPEETVSGKTETQNILPYANETITQDVNKKMVNIECKVTDMGSSDDKLARSLKYASKGLRNKQNRIQ